MSGGLEWNRARNAATTSWNPWEGTIGAPRSTLGRWLLAFLIAFQLMFLAALVLAPFELQAPLWLGLIYVPLTIICKKALDGIDREQQRKKRPAP